MKETEKVLLVIEKRLELEMSTLHFGGWVGGAQLAVAAFKRGGEEAMRDAGTGIGYRLVDGYIWAARKITLAILEDLGW